MTERPAKRARREAVFTTPPPSEAEREAEIAELVRRWAEEAQRAGLTEMSLLALQEIMMQFTEEERVRFCRLDRNMVRFCMKDELYIRLTTRDYPELSANWQKNSIVGGLSGANDGSWALYYRLLQRNRQCRLAVTLYWTSVGRRAAEINAINYEHRRLRRLPIETYFTTRSYARVREEFFIDGQRYIQDDQIDAACLQLFGDTALPWSRFYLALQNALFARELIGSALGARYRAQPNVRPEPIGGADLDLAEYYKEVALLLVSPVGFQFGVVIPQPREVSVATLILQPDGPLRRASRTYVLYTASIGAVYSSVIEQYPWYRIIEIFVALGCYEEQPSNDWMRPYLEFQFKPSMWPVYAYFIFVDFQIALRTGDNRRLWTWFDTARGSRPSLVDRGGVPLSIFVDKLRAGDSSTLDLVSLATIDYEHAVRVFERAFLLMRARINGARSGLATLSRGKFEEVAFEASRALSDAFRAADVFQRLNRDAEFAATQARLIPLRTQYMQWSQAAQPLISD